MTPGRTPGRAAFSSVRRWVAVAACLAWVGSASPLAASRAPDRYPHGAVVSVDRLASQAGADILAQGGSAADALVATALALVVVHPQAGNLTGGHFSLWRGADGTREVIDAREVAPAAATPTLFLDADGQPRHDEATDSPRASAVPGTVPGLALLHERHGRLPWRVLVKPALLLARDGFAVSPSLATSLQRASRRLSSDPGAQALFLPGGKPPSPGDRLVQPALARTLAALRDEGPVALTTGSVARQLVADMERRGGLISAQDLAGYAAQVRAPLNRVYRGHTVLVPPPPSAGGVTLLQALGALEAFPLEPDQKGGARLIHLQAEALRRGFVDRQHWMGDPDFVDVPVTRLLDAAHLETWREGMRHVQATPSVDVFPDGGDHGQEGTNTTHVSVIDRWGNAVAHTTTLNRSFGTATMAVDTGLFWNDEMDDFAIAPGVPNTYAIPGSAPNAIAPGKRPVSSMTPTIVEKGGHVEFVLGTPGGATIPSSILQVIINLVDLEAGPQEAVDAPRIHHQGLPDRLFYERHTLPPEVRAALVSQGYDLAPVGSLGDVQLLSRTPDGLILAAADPRRGGASAGH
ncbi:MAG: gamma-glutamyltransferase [Acidobacteriota bacterium]